MSRDEVIKQRETLRQQVVEAEKKVAGDRKRAAEFVEKGTQKAIADELGKAGDPSLLVSYQRLQNPDFASGGGFVEVPVDKRRDYLSEFNLEGGSGFRVMARNREDGKGTDYKVVDRDNRVVASMSGTADAYVKKMPGGEVRAVVTQGDTLVVTTLRPRDNELDAGRVKYVTVKNKTNSRTTLATVGDGGGVYREGHLLALGGADAKFMDAYRADAAALETQRAELAAFEKDNNAMLAQVSGPKPQANVPQPTPGTSSPDGANVARNAVTGAAKAAGEGKGFWESITLGNGLGALGLAALGLTVGGGFSMTGIVAAAALGAGGWFLGGYIHKQFAKEEHTQVSDSSAAPKGKWVKHELNSSQFSAVYELDGAQYALVGDVGNDKKLRITQMARMDDLNAALTLKDPVVIELPPGGFNPNDAAVRQQIEKVIAEKRDALPVSVPMLPPSKDPDVLQGALDRNGGAQNARLPAAEVPVVPEQFVPGVAGKASGGDTRRPV
jgi:hypothetical protein